MNKFAALLKPDRIKKKGMDKFREIEDMTREIMHKKTKEVTNKRNYNGLTNGTFNVSVNFI